MEHKISFLAKIHSCFIWWSEIDSEGMLFNQWAKKERRNKQASNKFMVVTMWHVRSPGNLGSFWKASGLYSVPAWHRFQHLRQNSWMASHVRSLPRGDAKLELLCGFCFFCLFVCLKLVQTWSDLFPPQFFWLSHLLGWIYTRLSRSKS